MDLHVGSEEDDGAGQAACTEGINVDANGDTYLPGNTFSPPFPPSTSLPLRVSVDVIKLSRRVCQSHFYCLSTSSFFSGDRDSSEAPCPVSEPRG